MCGQCDEMDREENEAAEERAALMDSEIACAVADAFTEHGGGFLPEPLRGLLYRLEAATRGSALRKVRP